MSKRPLTTFLTRASIIAEEALALQFSGSYGGEIITSSITTIESFAHRQGNLKRQSWCGDKETGVSVSMNK